MAKAAICIDSLETDVYIGTTEEEKSCKQKVKWFISISFPKRPKACKTDLLGDTICYDYIVDIIIKISCMKKYTLLEHLVATVYDKLKVKDTILLVRASKVIKSTKSYCPSFEIKDS